MGAARKRGNIKGKGEGMKLFKKLATTFVACALAVATTVPAFAADPANTSVIDTSKTTTLTIHKLLKDDQFSNSRQDDGTEKTVTGDPVEGVTFTAYKIEIPADKSAPAKDFTYNAADNKITSNGVEYTLGVGTEMKTGADGAVTETLQQGYYLVVETSVDGAKVNGEKVSITETCAPFIVRLPMTKPNSTEWNYNVHVYPKNSTSTATKTPSKTSVNVGEALSWDIKTAIPSGIENFQKFDVTDQLDKALTYTDNSAVVEVAGAIGDFVDFPATDQDKTNYTVTCVEGKLTVSFTDEGRKALANYQDVKVTFGTTVNENVLDATHQNVVKNTATVEFKNQDGTESKVPTPEAKVHTGKIDITKKSSADQTLLNGVEFKIASSEANATAGNYLKKAADGTILDVNDAGYADAADYVATTADGKASFAGLKDYDVANGLTIYRSYYIVETKAAAGYELLDAPVKVDFTADNSTEAVHYTISKDVLNTPKTNLPLTGGMGTVLFSVAGIALLGGAIALLVVRNRKSAKNA